MPITSQTVATRGRVVADDERYLVHDYVLDDLTVSMTELRKGQETKGHSHESNAEVYVFFGGAKGRMVVGDETFPVTEGAVLIPKGKFHKVINESQGAPLRFLAVFSGARGEMNAKYSREDSQMNRVPDRLKGAIPGQR
jgi:mannose-6-phosphate isomerase-like protein (cupin superfamily)